MKSCLARVVFLMMFSTTVAEAASPWVALHAGATSPTGDFSQVAGNGLNVGWAVAASDSARNAIGVAVNYDALAGKTNTFDILGIAQGALTTTPTIFEVAPFARIALAPRRVPVTPYLKGGFGMDYVVTKSTLAVSSTEPGTTVLGSPSSSRDTNTWLGLFAGIGLMVPTSRSAGLSIEGLFHQMKTGSTPINSVTIALEYWFSPRR